MNSLGLNNAELKNLLLEARQMIVVERMQWANKSKVHIYKGKKTFRFDSNTVIDRTARGVYQHSQMQEAIKAMKDFARSIFGDAETADQHGTETGKSLSERLHELQMGQQEAPLSCQESTKPAKAFTLRQVRIIFTGVTKAKQKGKPAYELTFPRMENRIRFGSFLLLTGHSCRLVCGLLPRTQTASLQTG